MIYLYHARNTSLETQRIISYGCCLGTGGWGKIGVLARDGCWDGAVDRRLADGETEIEDWK